MSKSNLYCYWRPFLLTIIIISCHLHTGLALSSLPLATTTRHCTLWSHDGNHKLGSLLERRRQDGKHEIVVKNDTSNNDESRLLCCFTIPYVETPGSVGSSLWPASLAGAILMAVSGELQSCLSEATKVLEVGSGLGLGGLVASQFMSGNSHSRKLTLSDNDQELVQLLQRHLNENAELFDNNNNLQIDVQQLDWRDIDVDPTNNNTSEDDTSLYDVCLGFDVAYYFHLLAPLINTLKMKLRRNAGTCLIVGPAHRDLQWQLYHHLKEGGYNQITDQQDEPWDGKTQMMLYQLDIGCWVDADDETDNDNDNPPPPQVERRVPIAALLHTPTDSSLDRLTDYDHVATQQDEAAQDTSF